MLLDRAWPPHNWDAPLKPNHISDAHLYGPTDPDPAAADVAGRAAPGQPTFYNTWPIPLHTSKKNLKNRATLRDLRTHLLRADGGPYLVLAVHLCGTLALRAVQLFNEAPGEVTLLALKPCCLPGMVHAQRDETFELGGHAFAARDVCSPGKFTSRGWAGPPRHHLVPKFERWTDHLARGAAPGPGGRTAVHYSRVQARRGPASPALRLRAPTPRAVRRRPGRPPGCPLPPLQVKGGYQNLYIFAERGPTLTRPLWARLDAAASAPRDGPASAFGDGARAEPHAKAQNCEY